MWHVVVINLMPFWRRNSPTPIRKHALHHYNNYFGTLAYILTLPIFGYPLLKYEKKLYCTVRVRAEVEILCQLVRWGVPVQRDDTEVLWGSLWDAVPWSKIEDYT